MEREPIECRQDFPTRGHCTILSIKDFATFDYLRGKFYKKDDSAHQKIVLFLCGATAGLSSLTITTPLEFVRVRLAMEKDIFTYKNNTNAFKTIFER